MTYVQQEVMCDADTEEELVQLLRGLLDTRIEQPVERATKLYKLSVQCLKHDMNHRPTAEGLVTGLQAI